MKLSPLDIRKQEFSRGMRGYDVDEVRAFLQTVAGQMDELIEEQVRVEGLLDDQKGKMGHLEDVQEALQATLNLARQNAEETRQTALTKAEMIIHEAHLKGEEILKRAERELDKLRTDIQHLELGRDQMLAKLRSVLNAELELLESLRPPPADLQRDSGVEVAGLAYLDPAAREYKEQKEAEKVEKAKTTPDNAADAAAEPAEAGEEEPDIAEVVAALKASVDEAPANDEQDQRKDDDLDEMQKIRRILDDLE